MIDLTIERKLLVAQLHCLYSEGELDGNAYIHCLGLENEQIERSIKVIVNRINTEKSKEKIGLDEAIEKVNPIENQTITLEGNYSQFGSLAED